MNKSVLRDVLNILEIGRNGKQYVMIWKEFPGYEILIFSKYNNYFVSLHGFSLDVTYSKSHWFNDVASCSIKSDELTDCQNSSDV